MAKGRSGKTTESIPRDPALAIASADSFRRLAQPFLDFIGRDFHVCNERAVRDLGGMVASATNLSLAVELYAKALHILSGRDVPKTHDLYALFAALPQPLRDAVVCEYEALGKPQAGVACTLELQLSNRDFRDEDEGRQSLGNPDNSIGSVLRRSRDVFHTWRYLYERGKSEECVDFIYEFHFLAAAATALRGNAMRLWRSHRSQPNT